MNKLLTADEYEIGFWERVKSGNSCWEWQGGRQWQGYGQMRYFGKTTSVHRLSWIIHFGEIPAGLCVCHKCDNPPCVRPDHLFLGTQGDNTRDCQRKGRRTLPSRLGGLATKGSKNGFSKLTEADVAIIWRRLEAGELHAEIARDYGVLFGTISTIFKRQGWLHVAPTDSEYARICTNRRTTLTNYRAATSNQRG